MQEHSSPKWFYHCDLDRANKGVDPIPVTAIVYFDDLDEFGETSVVK
jgi:hypothetical protein